MIGKSANNMPYAVPNRPETRDRAYMSVVICADSWEVRKTRAMVGMNHT